MIKLPQTVVVSLGAASLMMTAMSSVLPPTERSRLATVSAVLDVTPPVAVIALPTRGQVVSNVDRDGALDLGVAGTAAAADLDRWLLDVGSGGSFSGWTTIAAGSSPLTSACLGTWHTGPLTNGTYTIRLQVWDKAKNRSVATSTVALANFTVMEDVLEFDVGSDAAVKFTSVVPFPLTETLVIKNQQGTVVRTLVSQQRPQGTYNDTWDGRNDAGSLVPDAPYFYVATVTDGPRSLVWDLTNQFLNNYFDSKESLHIQPFDPFNNRPMTFAYNSPVPGNVTISVLTRSQSSNDCDQPPEKALCVVNRKYEESGPHTFVWAGVDPVGVYRASNYSLVSVTTVRDDFSKNAVVVYGTKPTIGHVAITPPVVSPGQSATVSFDLSTFHNQPADVRVKFLNQSSLSTLRTIMLRAQRPGVVSAPWDGRSDNGDLVAPGFYTITVTATDTIGNQVSGQILATVNR